MAGRVRAALGVAEGKATAGNHRDALAMKTDMTADLDIYRTAKLFIDRHGDDAVIEAAMKADKMLEQGDLDGLATWNRILRAIEELRAGKRPKDVRLH